MIDFSSIVPSYLGAAPRGQAEGVSQDLSDSVLRIGEVRRVVRHNDPHSMSGRFTEYEVEVLQRNGGGGTYPVIYRGVTTSTSFGGLADKVHYTLRTDSKPKKDGVGIGSKVLILCVSGDRNHGIILGGIRDPESEPDHDEAKAGHHFRFEFNGVFFGISDDGSAQIKVGGKTNADGSTHDSIDQGLAGTHFTIYSGGSAHLGSNDDSLLIEVNPEEKRIELLSENGAIGLGSATDLLLKVRDHGSWKVTEGALELTAFENVDIISAGVRIGDATDATLMGTTYRNNEKILHQQLTAALTTAQTAATVATGALTAVAGALLVPIAGPPIAGGIMAVVAASMATIASQLAVMMAAIQTFEGNGVFYLSRKNLSD